MKTLPNSSRRQSERGFAVLVVFAFLSIMLILVGANIRNLNWLHGELKLVEKRQIERLAPAATSTTNQPPVR